MFYPLLLNQTKKESRHRSLPKGAFPWVGVEQRFNVLRLAQQN